MMTSDGYRVGDGSWELTIVVTDIPDTEVKLRVTGDLHIGGVMLQLVENIADARDWSDHSIWWPDKNMWLSRTRSTLDQYGVQADATLYATPMHKNAKVQLPDLQLIDMRVDYSISVFDAVIKMCKELGIRHPEELSLSRKINREDLKKNKGGTATRRTRLSGINQNNHHHLSNNSLDSPIHNSPLRSPYGPGTPQGTLLRTPGTPNSPYNTLGHSPYSFNANGTMSPGSMHSLAFEGAMESMLANSPVVPVKEGMIQLPRPKNFAEKSRINWGWLDSSRSLMEQGIRENDIILLKYKFFNFYDLNPKYDLVRINQIYEQAKWSILSEEIDCTEEEMMMFSALQLQVQLQSTQPQPDINDANHNTGGDEIDAALNDLQVSLEGSYLSSPSDITKIPELQDYLKFFKPKKFTFKSYKRYYFVFKDTQLAMYRSREDMDEPPMMKVNLRGCEVSPDVNISAQKYNIKLFVPGSDGLSEVWIRSDTEEQYAKWMAAFKLASKGKTMADSSYDSEVQSILAFLSMQHPAPAPLLDIDQLNFQPEDFVSPRHFKKLRSKQLAQRILENHANVREMILLDAKMNFIRAWQALPEYGLTYFIIKLKGSKKEELLAVAFNRMIRMELSSGDSLKTWRFSNMQSWSVNWEVKQVQVQFEDVAENVKFECLTADCKVVHEFIGGYIFLSMRSGDKNQALNQEMFHKLTGGWA